MRSVHLLILLVALAVLPTPGHADEAPSILDAVFWQDLSGQATMGWNEYIYHVVAASQDCACSDKEWKAECREQRTASKAVLRDDQIVVMPEYEGVRDPGGASPDRIIIRVERDMWDETVWVEGHFGRQYRSAVSNLRVCDSKITKERAGWQAFEIQPRIDVTVKRGRTELAEGDILIDEAERSQVVRRLTMKEATNEAIVRITSYSYRQIAEPDAVRGRKLVENRLRSYYNRFEAAGQLGEYNERMREIRNGHVHYLQIDVTATLLAHRAVGSDGTLMYTTHLDVPHTVINDLREIREELDAYTDP